MEPNICSTGAGCGHAQAAARAIRRHQPGALPGQRHGAVIAHGVEDKPGPHPVFLHQRGHHAEQRQLGGEIRGAVDRVQNPHAPGLSQALQPGRAFGHSLLADNIIAGKQRPQARVQRALGRFIRHRHRVERAGFVRVYPPLPNA